MTELVLGSQADGVAELEAIRSWKRLDAGGAYAGEKIDEEQLWPQRPLAERQRTAVDDLTLATLSRRKQSGFGKRDRQSELRVHPP